MAQKNVNPEHLVKFDQDGKYTEGIFKWGGVVIGENDKGQFLRTISIALAPGNYTINEGDVLQLVGFSTGERKTEDWHDDFYLMVKRSGTGNESK